MNILKFKRGDTFILECTVPVNLTGWTVRSQVRYGETLVDSLTFEIVSVGAESSQYKLTRDITTDWPVGKLNCDIEYTTDQDQIISTETFFIECEKDSTV